MNDTAPDPEDPADPAFWGRRYEARETPWDLGGPHPEWARRFDMGWLRPAPGADRAWVPGAGRGHDARFLAAAGWRVIATDVAPEVRAAVGAELARAGVELVIGDALAVEPADLGGPVDLFVEHTFLCALPPARRRDWAALAARTVVAGGRLAALVFPVGKPAEEGGPPFGLDVPMVAALLEGDFRLVIDEPALPAPARRWGERFALFERVGGERAR